MTPADLPPDLSSDVILPKDFRPLITYDPDGDIIEAFWEPDNFVGKYVMPGLTLYLDRETDRVVGVLVDGVEMVKRRGIIRKGDVIE